MGNQSDNRDKKSNNELRGSARRSRLKLGAAILPDNNLGPFDSFCSNPNLVPSNQNLSQKTHKLNSSSSISDVLGNGKLGNDRWKLLRRSKQLLAMRTVTPELALSLDCRREWNLHRQVETLLDCFPSLKYSYSSLRGKKFGHSISILSNGSKARVDDIARSHSIRLDPVDSPKELFKYRQRIQKIITWAYANNLVPVMMTLTVFHRWHPLAPLCRILRNAWSDLFARSRVGLARKERVGFRGYIRRMEETFNDGDEDFDKSLNSGWHPHYHIVLIVPRDKLESLSAYEPELRKVWVSLVCKHYRKEFGEDIPASYLKSFEEHGLVFSRFKSREHALKSGCRRGYAGGLFEVKDGKYLAKLMGTDSPLYGGDTELTYSSKRSKTPFDLLRCEVTANVADLWSEYAIATKRIPCFTYSNGLQSEVDSYFDSLVGGSSVASSKSVSLPTEGVVVRLRAQDYQWLYRRFLIGELLDVAVKGYDKVKAWLKDSFGIEVLCDEPVEVKDMNSSSTTTTLSIPMLPLSSLEGIVESTLTESTLIESSLTESSLTESSSTESTLTESTLTESSSTKSYIDDVEVSERSCVVDKNNSYALWFINSHSQLDILMYLRLQVGYDNKAPP